MTTYRKRPVDVDMIQWTGANWPDIEAFAEKARPRIVAGTPNLTFHCAASASEPVIAPGDWIARERDGSGYYLINEAEQAATYEPPETPQGRSTSDFEAEILWTVALKGEPLSAMEATHLCAWVLARVGP